MHFRYPPYGTSAENPGTLDLVRYQLMVSSTPATSARAMANGLGGQWTDPQGGTSKGCEANGVVTSVCRGTTTMVGARRCMIKINAYLWENGLVCQKWLKTSRF
jgi:hypothetical protein